MKIDDDIWCPPPHPRLADAMAKVAAAERANSATLPASRLRASCAPTEGRGPAHFGSKVYRRRNKSELAADLNNLAARPGGVTVQEAQVATGRGANACRGGLSALAGLGRLRKEPEGRGWRYFKSGTGQ